MNMYKGVHIYAYTNFDVPLICILIVYFFGEGYRSFEKRMCYIKFFILL